MAKIQLVIDAEDATDLRNTIIELNGVVRFETKVTTTHVPREPEPEPEAQVTEGEPPRRRGRPPKAQEPAPATTSSDGTTTSTEPDTSISASTATNPVTNPFMDQIKRSFLTAADVKAAGAEYMKTHTVADSMALIKKIAGVESFGQVPEDKYEELHAALKAG